MVSFAKLKKIIFVLLKQERQRVNWQKSKAHSILKLLIIYNELKQIQPTKRKWVSEIFSEKNRILQGATNNLINTMKIYDENAFYNFLRYTPTTFEKLLGIVGPFITKLYCVRTPIKAETRLQITLRFLATGDNFHSLSYLFRVSPSSIHNIIFETCEAVWSCLRTLVFPEHNEKTWKDIAKGFYKKWDFPHCLGAVDGKLVRVQAPPNSGSYFYDYKGHHSIHFMGYADAYQKFTIVDIGAAGRQSDGGVFNNSETGKRLKENKLNVPSSEPLVPGSVSLPYVFVGDEAFALSNFMLRPYPRSSNLDLKKKVFNYRLSRARRIVESAFGTLTAVWQVLRTTIPVSVPVAIEVIKACICLHNFSIMYEKKGHKMDRSEDDSSLDIDFPKENNNNFNITKVTEIREEFAHYFMNEGAVDYQWNKAVNNEF